MPTSFDGFRKTVANEFDEIYCYNLRGDQRTSGEKSRQEGGKIFGSSSRAGVAIPLLVKKPTGEADRRSRQAKPTGEADRRSRQAKPTGEADRRSRQAKPIISKPTRRSRQAKPIVRSRQAKPTGEDYRRMPTAYSRQAKPDRRSRQAKPTGDSRQAKPTGRQYTLSRYWRPSYPRAKTFHRGKRQPKDYGMDDYNA